MIKLYKAKTTDFTQADYTNQYSLLEHAIRQKIDLKKNEQSKKQSLAGYILLFKAIGELYLQSKIKIEFNEHGKPYCDFCFFNISHSNELVVLAIGDEPVGIDVQKMSTVTPRTHYKCFNDKEINYVNYDNSCLQKRYIEIFTKKESAIKMLGLSLAYAHNIDTFSKEYLFDISEQDGYMLAICRKNVSIM